jgi:hypothetical protein
VNIIVADAWQAIVGDDMLKWLACLFILLGGANQIFSLIGRFKPQWIKGTIVTSERDEWARKSELEKLEKDVQAQFKEQRAYLHDEIHKLRDDFQHFSTSSEVQREGIHGRINVVCEVLYYIKGKLDNRGRAEA